MLLVSIGTMLGVPYEPWRSTRVEYKIDGCCIELKVYNPSCDLLPVKLEKKTTMNGYEKVDWYKIPKGGTKVWRFCADEGTTVFQFRIIFTEPDDENVRIGDNTGQWPPVENNHMRTYTTDLPYCHKEDCKCPPSGRRQNSDWIKVTSGSSSNCGPNECSLDVKVNIPDEIKCYTHYKIMKEYKGVKVDAVSHSPLPGNQFENSSICVPKGSMYHVWLMLYKADGTECVQSAFAWAACVDRTPQADPCESNCTEPWIARDQIFENKNCLGCFYRVKFLTRKGCGGQFQELQLTQITTLTPNKCMLCLVTKDIYKQATGAVIAGNQMDFKPRMEGDCDDTWRILTASCWGEWEYTRYELGPDGIYYPVQVKVYEPCINSGCCAQRYKVCRVAGGGVKVEPIGAPVDNSKCVDAYVMGRFGQKLPCEPSCEWLDNIPGAFPPVSVDIQLNVEQETFRFKQTINKAESVIEGTSIKVSQNTEKLNVEMSADGHITAINIYDIQGNLVAGSEFLLQKGRNIFDVDINRLTTGVYILNVKVDGLQVKSDKISIVR